MAKVAELVAELHLETAAFKREMRAARQETQSFHSSITKMAKTAAASFAGMLTIGAVVQGFRTMSRATLEAEQSQARLEGVIRATGMAAGLTAEQVGELADRIERTTLFDDKDIERAAAKLLTFKSIAGDTFRRTLEAATDLSADGFGSVESAAVQLGKALEDPVRGLASLREVGVTFTVAQEKQIKALAESGRKLEAQGVLLGAVEGQVEDVAEAMRKPGGLTDATKGATDAWSNMLEGFGRTSSVGGVVIPMLEGITDFLENMAPTDKTRLRDVAEDLARFEQFSKRTGIPTEWLATVRQLREEYALLMEQVHGLRLPPAIVKPGPKMLDTVVTTVRPVTDREKSLRRLIDGYREEARALSMSADAYELYQATALGASAAELDVIRSLQDTRHELDENKTAWDAWAALVSADARAATDAILAEHQRIREDTAEMLKELDDLQREMADETAGHWQHAADEAQGAMKDFYKTLLLDGRAAFGDLLASWADTLAEMAALQAVKATGHFAMKLLGFDDFMGGFSSNSSSSLSPLTQPMTGPVSGPGIGASSSSGLAAAPTINITMPMTFSVQALDSRDVGQWLQAHGPAITAQVVQNVRRSRGVARELAAGMQ